MSFQSLERSTVWRAFATSVALHILLLWPATVPRQAAVPAARLAATLRVSPSAAMADSTPLPMVTARKPPAPRSIAPIRPKPRQAPDSPPALPLALTDADARRSGGAARPATTVLTPSEGSLDAEGLRGYRLALARQARGHSRYPRQAEDAGCQGTAEVRVTVLSGGLAQDPELLRSSGHAALDRAAVEMLRNALPATPVPPALRHQTFVVDLPVVFELPE